MLHPTQLTLLEDLATAAAPALNAPLPQEILQCMADLLLQLALTTPDADNTREEETDEILP